MGLAPPEQPWLWRCYCVKFVVVTGYFVVLTFRQREKSGTAVCFGWYNNMNGERTEIGTDIIAKTRFKKKVHSKYDF